MDTITEGVMVAIRKIIRASDLYSSELRRSTGLTSPQILLLQAAADKPGATLGELSEIIHLSQATASTILDRLEEEALLERYRSELDRRKMHVRLTGKGREVLKSAPKPMQSCFINQFQDLKPHERSAILSSFQHVAEMMLPDEASMKRDRTEPPQPIYDEAC